MLQQVIWQEFRDEGPREVVSMEHGPSGWRGYLLRAPNVLGADAEVREP